MTKYKEPEELNGRAPQWFKDWHSRSFWHFKYGIETKMALHDKLLWIILAAIVAAAIANKLF